MKRPEKETYSRRETNYVFSQEYEGDMEKYADYLENKPFWTQIDPDNLPKGKVLVTCFNNKSECYKKKLYGKIIFEWGVYHAVSRGDSIWDITHYYDIDQHDKENE